ncbi:hypothetical protein OHA98_42445 [Streptomyces sp. NBC_00654]|uniref:hypothetical protein n=1 Tax=Streptomyces sp. NBC_00654 TaxID=2975799 RepID=UPI002252EF09|nr:hypothetical protein [Streptomyces sp. NBC_00654]MCX4971262.1 hypothetical protein [Streptomyces sp. NBC_00654]
MKTVSAGGGRPAGQDRLAAEQRYLAGSGHTRTATATPAETVDCEVFGEECRRARASAEGANGPSRREETLSSSTARGTVSGEETRHADARNGARRTPG